MNLGRVGGILEAKKIAGMAEACYAEIAPHLYDGPIGAAACIHPCPQATISTAASPAVFVSPSP
jgi:L-alanine-DL-glutamate epimerase-like enolase superfamily enzyme